jgi:hypothetical protein
MLHFNAHVVAPAPFEVEVEVEVEAEAKRLNSPVSHASPWAMASGEINK